MKNQRLITDVGIDLDGVVYPFIGAFKKYCIEVLKKDNFVKPTKWNFYEDWGILKTDFEQMLNEASKTHKLFASELPMPLVQEGWDILKTLNVKLHVITARPSSAWAQTAEWLHRFNLIPSHLHFTHDKTIISHVAQNESAMIDDHVDYYKELERSGTLAVLLTQDWNIYYDGAIRANSLVDFATIVKNVNNREIPWIRPIVNKSYLMQ